MDLLSFYSRKFTAGDLVTVFKSKTEMIGYGILITEGDIDICQGAPGKSEMYFGDSFQASKRVWRILINDAIKIIPEWDIEHTVIQ